MAERTEQRRQQGLQQAASVVFALMGIVPLLVFAFTLWQIGAIHHTLAQAALVLTLVLMLLGFWLFRSMLARMSENVSALARAVEQAVRTRSLAVGPAAPATARPGVAPSREAAPPLPRQVAGFGAIKELGEMARTMELLWEREARVHVGRRVQITVSNSQELAGVLVEATEEGLLLEQPGGETLAITYHRVQGIEPLPGG
jgi:hypothetical protein